MAITVEKKFRVWSVIENLGPSGLPEGDPEKTEVSVSGLLKIEDSGFSISYSEVTDGVEVVSDINIKANSVNVSRRGGVVSNMYFEEGVCHKSLYEVPPYSFDAEIRTRKIRNNMTRDGGRVDIFYDMKIGGAEKSVRMKIEAL